VQELRSPPRASSVVKDCIRHTYDFLVVNCDEMKEAQGTTTNRIEPSLKCSQFWNHFMYLLTRIINEDRERYNLVLNHQSSSVYIVIFLRFILPIVQIGFHFYLFKEHARVPANRRGVKSADYINLYFKVKKFYNTSVKIIPEAKNIVPEYPKWLEPFVMQWLNEYDDMSMEYLHNALEKDR
ncbi:unnamed protein product, partial [Rotaria sp. Silwood2]